MADRMVFYKVQWRGIVLLVMHHIEADDRGDVAISVRSLRPFNAPLPGADGGNFGYGCRPESIEAAGGPVPFIIAWLTRKAKKADWRPATAPAAVRWWDDGFADEYCASFDDLPLIEVGDG